MSFSYKAELTRKSLEEGKRISGRAMDEPREPVIEVGTLYNADGSASVKLGKTEVVAGIKFALGTPYPDSPDEGSIIVGIEMSPMADPSFESGPPSSNAVELSRVVDRGIRESGALDFKKLSIVEGEKMWMVFCDVHVINNDGNLFDACSIAALAALKNAKVPKLDEDNNIIKGEYGGNVDMNFMPLLFTFAKVGDTVILDPDLYEQEGADARYSVAVKADGSMTAMQKGLAGTFTCEEIKDCVSNAVKNYKKQIKFLE